MRHTIKKDGSENLTLTRHKDGNRNRERRRETHIKDLCKWMIEQGLGGIVSGQTLLNDRKLRRTMLAQEHVA